MNDDLQLPISFFDNQEDNIVNKVDVVTWAEFKELMSEHDIRDTGNTDRDKNGLAFMMVLWKDAAECEETIDGYPRRTGVNVDYYYAIHLDFDCNVTIEAVRKKLLCYEHFGYTSYNHWRDYGKEKFRVVLPLANPITPSELTSRKDDLLAWLGTADKSTLSIGRLFFMPSTSKKGKLYARTWSNRGNLFDITTFAEKKVELAPVGVVAATIPDNEMNAAIIKELRKIDLSEYDDWFCVGGAMFNAGFTLADYQSVTMRMLLDHARRNGSSLNVEHQCQTVATSSISFAKAILSSSLQEQLRKQTTRYN